MISLNLSFQNSTTLHFPKFHGCKLVISTLIFKDWILVYVCGFCRHLSRHCVHVVRSEARREVLWSLPSCRLLWAAMWFFKLNPGPLQEQLLCLTAVQFLEPPVLDSHVLMKSIDCLHHLEYWKLYVLYVCVPDSSLKCIPNANQNSPLKANRG